MIITALKSLSGQIMMVFLAATAAWGWLKMHDKKVEQRTVEQVQQRSQMEGAARAKKSDQAHARAKSPGAADRLRNDPATCPDCKR